MGGESDMTTKHGTHDSDNSESELIKSLGELPEEVLTELEQLPPKILKSLAEKSSEAQDCLTRLPLGTLRQISGLTAPTLEWLGSVGVGELNPGELGKLVQLVRESPDALAQLKFIPPQVIKVLALVPGDVLSNLVELPQ